MEKGRICCEQVRLIKISIAKGNKIISKLLNSVGSGAGLSNLRVVRNEKSLGSLNDDNPFFALFRV